MLFVCVIIDIGYKIFHENPRGEIPGITEIPKISEELSPENSWKTPDVFSYKCNDTERKSSFLLLKNKGRSRKISGKF